MVVLVNWRLSLSDPLFYVLQIAAIVEAVVPFSTPLVMGEATIIVVEFGGGAVATTPRAWVPIRGITQVPTHSAVFLHCLHLLNEYVYLLLATSRGQGVSKADKKRIRGVWWRNSRDETSGATASVSTLTSTDDLVSMVVLRTYSPS